MSPASLLIKTRIQMLIFLDSGVKFVNELVIDEHLALKHVFTTDTSHHKTGPQRAQ